MIRVLLNGTPYPENYLSWQERKEMISRSELFKGVIITQSLELQFIKDACNYILELENDYDIAAECTIKIQYHDAIEGWKDGFEGYLDFKTLKKDTKDVKKCTISAYDSGFANKILERVEMEIPYDRNETIDGGTIAPKTDNGYKTVTIEGIEVLSTNVATILPEPSASNTNFPGFNNSSQLDGWVSTVYKTATGAGSADDDWIRDRAFFFPNNFSGILKGEMEFKFLAPDQPTITFQLWDYKKGVYTPIQTTVLESAIYNYPGVEATVNFDFEYEFDSDTRLCLYWGASTSVGAIAATS